MSRLRIISLFVAVLALAAVFAACGQGGGGSVSNDTPQQVLDEATLLGVSSGNLDLSVGVDAQGSSGGNIDASLSGPFQGQGQSQLPQVDLAVKVNGSMNGKDVNFDGGLTLLADRAYVGYKGTEYEIDPTMFSFVTSLIQQQSASQGQSGLSGSCQKSIGNFKVSDFVDKPTDEGSTDVGGTSTTHVSGDLDLSGAVDQLSKTLGSPGCRAQLSTAGQLPSAAQLDMAKAQLSSVVKTAHVDVYVGDDKIIRRISVQMTLEPPAGAGAGKVDLSFDLTLNDVNKPQTISAPSESKSINDLFRQLGINPLSLVRPGGLGSVLGGGAGGGGLGGLLNGIGGGNSNGPSGSGSSGSGGSPSPQTYLQCLQGATTPADLQRCASLQ